ncbi:hypothetical protein F0562_013228 [Nyssa sinensis]|uniref:Uncharacterized protein n=1 Tax=Nyssa sinensis TaxID=561372 RepID=A0A5J4ZZC3_9ASTE|nr:hypothetical protein F0562_013228 [Nyssa sinensis]
MISTRYGSSSPRRHSVGATHQRQTLSGGKHSGLNEKAASDLDNSSEYSDKHSEAGSQQSVDDFRHHKEFFRQSRLAVVDGVQNFTEDIESRLAAVDGGQSYTDDIELLGFGVADSEERLSDISDGDLSMGTETDGSMSSIVEFTLFPETAKPVAENTGKPNVPSKLPKPQLKQVASQIFSVVINQDLIESVIKLQKTHCWELLFNQGRQTLAVIRRQLG